MILGAFWMLVANAAAGLGAFALLQRVATSNPSVDLVLFLLIRLLLISGTLLIAGLAGIMSSLGVGLLATAVLAILLGRGEHLRLPPLRWPDLGRASTWIVIAMAMKLLAQVWLFSPHLGDALAYHLPKIAEWIRVAGFSREMGVHPHVTFPAGFELVETWWVVFLHHDVLIEMGGLEFLALASSATYALARYLGLSQSGSGFAALAYALVPGLNLSATSCLNDVPVAGLVLSTAALVLWRASFWMVLLSAGLGMGTKATYLYTLPGWFFLSLLVWREAKLKSPSVGWCVSLAFLSVMVGLFWYARNAIWYENPFYPVGSFGYDQEAVAVQVGPKLSSLWRNFSDLIETRITDSRGAYGAFVDNIAGWGPLVFACGPLSLFLGLFEDRGVRRLSLSFGVALVSCFLLMIHDLWSLRYVFFFPALLCIATARLAEKHQGVRRIAFAAMGFSFVGTLLPYDIPLKDLKALAAQPWRTRTTLLIREPELGEGPVACFGGYSANSYLLYGPSFSRRVVFLRSTSPDDLVEDMRRAGAEILYAAPMGGRQEEILRRCIRGGRLKSVRGKVFKLE
jgi:hypothetical protein